MLEFLSGASGYMGIGDVQSHLIGALQETCRSLKILCPTIIKVAVRLHFIRLTSPTPKPIARKNFDSVTNY